MRCIAVIGMILSLGLFAWCDEKEELEKQLKDLEENIQKLAKDFETLNSKKKELQTKLKGDTGTLKGYLGIIAADLTEEQKKAFKTEHGVVILDVIKNTPAATAEFHSYRQAQSEPGPPETPGAGSLQRWDIITSINSEKVENAEWLRDFIQDKSPGETVSIQTLNAGDGNYKIRLARRSILSTLQLDVVELSEDQRAKLDLSNNEGLVVTSRSETIDAHAGDILTEIANKKDTDSDYPASIKVGSYTDLEKLITEGGKYFKIKVLCGHEPDQYFEYEREFEKPVHSMGHDF